MKMLEDPAARIAWKIRDIHHKHMSNIHGIISRYGLHPGQPRILHVINDMNGATQNEIAEQLQVSPATLAMSIKRMQKAGLLQKVNDEKDLRVNKILLTELGQQVQEASLADIIKVDDSLLVGFTPQEVVTLESYLERIYKNLENGEESLNAR